MLAKVATLTINRHHVSTFAIAPSWPLISDWERMGSVVERLDDCPNSSLWHLRGPVVAEGLWHVHLSSRHGAEVLRKMIRREQVSGSKLRVRPFSAIRSPFGIGTGLVRERALAGCLLPAGFQENTRYPFPFTFTDKRSFWASPPHPFKPRRNITLPLIFTVFNQCRNKRPMEH